MNKLEQFIEDNEESSDNTEDEQQEETNLECEKLTKRIGQNHQIFLEKTEMVKLSNLKACANQHSINVVNCVYDFGIL